MSDVTFVLWSCYVINDGAVGAVFHRLVLLAHLYPALHLLQIECRILGRIDKVKVVAVPCDGCTEVRTIQSERMEKNLTTTNMEKMQCLTIIAIVRMVNMWMMEKKMAPRKKLMIHSSTHPFPPASSPFATHQLI
jgi:hypothetical protein